MRAFLRRGFGNPVLLIVLAVPLLSAIVGGVLLTLAYQSDGSVANNQAIPRLTQNLAPLSKTSWRGPQPQIAIEVEIEVGVEMEAGP